MSQWHGGKGSGRRKEDARKFSNNWDRIFGKPNSGKPKGDSDTRGSKETTRTKRPRS